MIPVTAFAANRSPSSASAASGLATALALIAGGATVAAWDDNAEARAEGRGRRAVAIARSRAGRTGRLRCAGAVARRAADPSRAALDGEARRGRRGRNHRRHRAVLPRAPAQRAAGALHRHHRHQRQIDDDGADRAYAARRRARRAARRQYRHARSCRWSRRRPAAIHVIECSSYQIDLAPSLDPSVGVLLNVTPDHLDRHGTMDELRRDQGAARRRRARWRSIGVDDGWCQAIADRFERRGQDGGPGFRRGGRSPTASIADGPTLLRGAMTARRIRSRISTGIGSLRGAHNAAERRRRLRCLRARRARPDEIAARPSHLSRPARTGWRRSAASAGSLFVNDSKATNADAAAKALGSFERIYWIAGGRAKEGGIAACAELLPARSPRPI